MKQSNPHHETPGIDRGWVVVTSWLSAAFWLVLSLGLWWWLR